MFIFIGSKLERRLTEREREAAKDAEDRAREKEEIEELRVQVLNEGHADPNAELERRMAAMVICFVYNLFHYVDFELGKKFSSNPKVCLHFVS